MEPVIQHPIPKIPMTIEALNQLAAVAMTIKGRKNLVWFTYGVPPSGGILRAIKMLAEAQVTTYSVGARGGYYVFSKGHNQIPVMYAKGSELLNLEGIAEAGGGISFHDRNDLATGIARAIDNGSHYYTLTYAPPDPQYDGRGHTISVKLTTAHPGVKLTYLDKYAAEDPAQILPAPQFTLNATPPTANVGGMRVAMARSQPASTQLLFDAKVEPSDAPASPADPPIFGTLDPKLKSKPLTRYSFDYAIPARQIAFTADATGIHRGAIELDIAVYDGSPYGNGQLVTGISQTVNMPLSDARYQQFIQGPFRFTQQLDLPPGPLFLRIGVFDPTANKIGTLEIPLTVPKTPTKRAAASRPQSNP
jgi:hypothetical protein